MKNSIKIAELNAMSPEEREATLKHMRDIVLSAPSEELDWIDDEIREFERRYETNSATMLYELNKGLRKETAEICTWIILLRIKHWGPYDGTLRSWFAWAEDQLDASKGQ